MKSTLPINILSTFVLALIIAACSSASKDKNTQLAELKAQYEKIGGEIRKLEEELAKENPGKKITPTNIKEVNVAELAPKPFDYYIQTQGSVEAVDNILVSARTAGIISQVYVVEGSIVTKGQTLAQIDNSLIVRNIEELKAALDLSNTVYERQKNLWEQKIGTEVQYLQAKNNKESLEKRLATLNEQLDMSKIKSPINGSVDEVALKIGQNAAPGLPAFRVVSSDKLKLKANVSEAYVTSVKTGNSASLVFSDIHKNMNAKVTFVGRTINQLSRTFPVEIALPSNVEDLRPNMTGVLKIVFKTVPSAIAVPVNVVQDINGEKIVYVAEQDGANLVARKKAVKIGGVFGSYAEVVSGLKSGDKLITVGFQGLDDGEPVKI